MLVVCSSYSPVLRPAKPSGVPLGEFMQWHIDVATWRTELPRGAEVRPDLSVAFRYIATWNEERPHGSPATPADG